MHYIIWMRQQRFPACAANILGVFVNQILQEFLISRFPGDIKHQHLQVDHKSKENSGNTQLVTVSCFCSQ